MTSGFPLSGREAFQESSRDWPQAWITAGFDGQNDQDVFNAPDGVVSSRIFAEGLQSSIGVFGEVSLKPVNALEILGGLRFDQFRDEDGTIITDGVVQRFGDRRFDFVSPRVAARYQLTEPLAVRAAYYRGFRAPTLAQRYRSFESPTFRGLGNPDLREERLTGYDAGLEVRTGAVTGQANYFYNRMKDFIGSAEVGFVNDKFTVQNENIARTRSKGVELMADVRLASGFGAAFSYTYTDAIVTEGPFAGNRVEGVPENAVSLSLYYRGPALRWNVRGRYASESFQEIGNTAESFQDARFIVDASIAYAVRKNLELFLVALNLFDQQYISDGLGATLGAPRQVSAGVRASF
jgi:outer membrane receptor protein involved in Fe transport